MNIHVYGGLYMRSLGAGRPKAEARKHTTLSPSLLLHARHAASLYTATNWFTLLLLLLLLLCRLKPGSEVDIGMRVRLVHGDEVISDSETDGGFQGACAKFKAWVRQQYFAGKDQQME
jgi:hypothetical protein